MLRLTLYVVSFVIVFSCQQTTKRDNQVLDKSLKEVKLNFAYEPDSCRVVFSQFKYPEDINSMCVQNYICKDSTFWHKYHKIRNLRHKVLFQDNNYLLIQAELDPSTYRSCLLWDKQKDKVIVIERYLKRGEFTRDNIKSIYFLDKNMQLSYLIRKSDEDIKTLEVSMIKIRHKEPDTGDEYQLELYKPIPPLKDMNYADILELEQVLQDKTYKTHKMKYEFRMNSWWH